MCDCSRESLPTSSGNRSTQAFDPRVLFLVGLVVASSGLLSPPLALALGITLAMTAGNPYDADSRVLGKFLLQASVVALGFGMDFHTVIQTGRSSFAVTAVSIVTTVLLGMSMGMLLRVQRKTAFLISVGTAICGGSAIAAIGPVVQAREEEMGISLGTIFVLNSIALLVFPAVGAGVGLSQSQFGVWSALAIHDTSSVVGAASHYGSVALTIATTVKLTRAIWIVPVVIATTLVRRGKAKIKWPWFILFFCIAAALSTSARNLSSIWQPMSDLGKHGLTATLFLIGSGLSRSTLREVGWRPMIQGLLLWIVISVVSLIAIHWGWLAI